MTDRFQNLQSLEEIERNRTEARIAREIEEDAEKLYKEGETAASLAEYAKILEGASVSYILEHPQSLKRSIEIIDGYVENALKCQSADDDTLMYAKKQYGFMNLFLKKFEADENGEIYVEIADNEFRRKYETKSKEQLAKVYHYLDMIEEIEYVVNTYLESTDPEFAYVTGLFLEKAIHEDEMLTDVYGAVLIDAFESYLCALDPFKPDIDKIKHAHGLLDYYYGFGYGVPRNLRKSMLHENANKSINQTQGRNKAQEMKNLLAGITSYGK